ncbi:MAG: hypothetical protein ACRD9R_12065 [Pyrinomonadaceae bacterium]
MKRKTAVLCLSAVLLLVPQVARTQQTPPAGCSPGVSFWKLLDAVKVGYADGRLSIDNLYAVCLPAPARQSGTNYAYDPDAGGNKLSMSVKRPDGQALNTYVWYAESIGGLWELSRYKVVGGYQAIKPLGAGDYVLEFAIEDKPFQRFPFSVAVVDGDDPYAPAGKRYFIEGAWNDYGNLFYQRNDPASSLRFTTWVREKAGHESKRSVPYEVKLVRERDGKPLATDAATLRLEPRWLQADLLLRPTEGDQNSYFKAGDLLREDGAYSVRFTLDGKPYGTYPFTVKGGRIQFQGRQVREGTDPSVYIVDYLSGGRYSSWWVKREGAK